ncbi:hypothetical protein HYH02_004830 [Chlamydomonas schloesseri]|uniref:Uncharacterized protein n=1 Tax=Chlamydomonas schloesseri TaxID=2026947 RepID=A0A835WMP2_9CHLO|nr:hypothetical protein HYH02_004830 [Chlamydomonas schloesseri]|eukprot:KAG2450325.1 hypothetical protein HYH02_004830 [Chlamydomonas schloesseri]
MDPQQVIKDVAGPLSIVGASFVISDGLVKTSNVLSKGLSKGFVDAAGVLGSHIETGLKGHMASEGAGQHLLATGMGLLSNAIKDRKPFFSLLSFGW